MKKELLALSLIAFTSLYSEAEAKKPQLDENGYCSTCYSYPCCCEPCCEPEPRKCIDCECYIPPFYDLQCDWGVSLDLEFLYWYAGETNLSYALELKNTQIAPGVDDYAFSPHRFKHISTKWDPGFRVGLGWNSDCDGWDTQLNWTYMKNCQSSSSSVPLSPQGILSQDASILINPWINFSFAGFELNFPLHQVKAEWNFHYNQIDLEWGRKSWVSRCFALRPYAAVRGAWWKTRFETDSIHESSDQTRRVFNDRFTNRVWGVGLLGGLQPTWYFCTNFALYANFDGALLWGDFEAKKREKYTSDNRELPLDFQNSSSSCFSQMTAMLDTAIGLRWEETWCCDRYRTAFDLGWEHHILFDQNHRMQTTDFFSSSTQLSFLHYNETTGNLGMGGFVLRLRFDF